MVEYGGSGYEQQDTVITCTHHFDTGILSHHYALGYGVLECLGKVRYSGFDIKGLGGNGTVHGPHGTHVMVGYM